MLSAFSPRSIVELRQRDKSKIESLLAYGDRLFVGLNTGSLRIYRVKENAPSEAEEDENAPEPGDREDGTSGRERPVELLREEEKFSRRAIQQLGLIRDANILISLSDSHVWFHDLQTFELSEKLDATRGATTFAVTSNIFKDEETEIPMIVSRLAVAVKRKILIWTWQDMELIESAREMTMVHSPKSLTWATGTKLVVGMDGGFVLLDAEKQSVQDINRPPGGDEPADSVGMRFGAVTTTGMGYMGMGSWIPKPLAAKMTDDEVLLAKDVNSLFIDTQGQPIEKRQVPWPTAPESIGYSYPYLLVLLTGQKPGLELRNPQTLSLLQFIPLTNATILHVPQPNISLAHAGKGFLVASDRGIWRMDALKYESQIDELVEKSRFDEALSFVGLLEDTLLLDKTARLRNIKILKAQYLFDQKQFRDALDLFSSAEAPPERVISLYPSFIAGTRIRTVKADTSDPPQQDSSPKKISKHKRMDSRASTLSRKSTESDGRGGSVTHALEGTDLKFAVNELCAFLAQTHFQLQKFINFDGTLKEHVSVPPKDSSEKPTFEHYILQELAPIDFDWGVELHRAATLVDTTLFRAYMHANPRLAGPLFRLDNFCDPNVVQEKLYEQGRYNEVIEFLQGKKLHEEALKLLEKIGKGESEDEAPENLRGPKRTVAYLQQLPGEMIDLILKYAEWPLRVAPKMGIEIFTVDTANAEYLPRGRVIQHLRGIDTDLELEYLEHVLSEFKDQTPEFHDRLARLCILKITQSSTERSSETEAMQRRLEDLLRSSEQYHKSRLLKELPADDSRFYESRAVVHGKLAQHSQALEIYVFEMQNYKKAEDYCNEIHHIETAKSAVPIDPDTSFQISSVYTILLSLYLAPPKTHETNFDAALELLSRHGSRLPALKTLELLPDKLPLQELELYFRRRMRAANSIAREQAIVASLSKVEKIDADAALLVGEGMPEVKPVEGVAGAGRNRRVVISENKLCVVCHKRFGRAAIRVWPNGDVLHYGCSDRRHQA